jgi:methionyl-tRNA formyltransferase
MKIIFLGKHIGDNNNCLGLDALKYLYITKQLKNIKCVVKEKDLLYNYCIKNNIEVTHNIKDYTNTDLIISYGWHKLIPKNIIESSRIGCINFHPAPLPEWRGMGGVFNFALFKEITEWGVSAHFVDENFDTGDIIKTNKFKINPTKETIYSLTKKSHNELLVLFKEVLDLILKNKNSTTSIPRKKQTQGNYISKYDLDKLRKVQPNDSIEIIDRKIRSCFCPPYHGAYITIKGKQYSIINDEILNKIKLK